MAPYETTLSSKWPPSMQKMGVPLESYVPFEKESSVFLTDKFSSLINRTADGLVDTPSSPSNFNAIYELRIEKSSGIYNSSF